MKFVPGQLCRALPPGGSAWRQPPPSTDDFVGSMHPHGVFVVVACRTAVGKFGHAMESDWCLVIGPINGRTQLAWTYSGNLGECSP